MDVQPPRVVPSMLNEYGEASNHAHASVAEVIVREPDVHSNHVASLKLNVGAVLSLSLIHI